MEETEKKGVTIRELKAFLNKLPKEFDDFGMVNGEVVGLEEYYARIDKPVVHLEIDEQNKEFLILHQSGEELETIINKINGTT